MKAMKYSRAVVLFFILAALAAAAPGPTRVQVIAPSRPLADTYQTLTVVARAEDGSVDRAFIGDAWLWTDGPYLRPYHVYFRAEDRGVIQTPAMLELPVLTRIEAYQTDGVIHSWSNPVLPRARGGERDYAFVGVLPVDEQSSGPPLFWGRLDKCDEPGLDFCIAIEGGPLAPEGLPALTAIKTVVEGETWVMIPDPESDQDERNALVAALRAASDRKALYAVLGEHSSTLASIMLPPRVGPGNGLLGKVGGLIVAGPDRPPHILALADQAQPGRDLIQRLGLKNQLAAYSAADRLPSVIPSLDSNLGVWAVSDDPASLWRSLRMGLVYGSHQGRTLLLYPSEPDDQITLLVAGAGPREEVSILCWDGKDLAPLLSKSDDDFHLTIRFADPGRPCFIEVHEPGPGRASTTLAGPFPRFAL
jgi:hypothetical protein